MRPGPDWGLRLLQFNQQLCAIGEAAGKERKDTQGVEKTPPKKPRSNRCRKVLREKQFHFNIIDVKLILKVWFQFEISWEITFCFAGRPYFAS